MTGALWVKRRERDISRGARHELEARDEGKRVRSPLFLLFHQESRSQLKGMPQKDLINIRNYDVRYLIPKVCSALLKNGAEILTESGDSEMNHPFKVILLQRFQKLYRKVWKASLSLSFRAVDRRSQNVNTNNLIFG